MQRCPYCAKPNQPSASFCIHCGESIDEESLLEHASDQRLGAPSETTSSSAQPVARLSLGRLFSSERALEFVAGFAILLGVLGFALYIGIQQNGQYEHYKRAQEAEQRKEYELALAEYSAAGDYRDTSLRSSKVRDRIAERDKEYTIALQNRKERRWWQAARSLLQVEEIQPNFKDTRDQLADVRRVNGVIFYKQAGLASGQSSPGIFVAYADGGDPVALPLTGERSTVLAVSPDSRWVAYDLNTGYEPAVPRALYLYDAASRAAYPLHVEAAFFPSPITARFTADSQKLWLTINGTSFSYSLPHMGSVDRALRPDSPPAAPSSPRVEREIVVRSVTIVSPAHIGVGTKVLVVSNVTPQPEEAARGSARHVATEEGIVDGAVFNSSGDLLLYRVCGQLDREGSYVCRLRLVDLVLQALYPNTIASMAVHGRDMHAWELTGGFTRDGRHVLLIEKLHGEATVRLYTPNTGDTWTLTGVERSALSAALSEDLLLPLGVPGLSQWRGKNALTRTKGAMPLPEARAEWPQRYFGVGHWVAASPSDRHLLYLGHDASAGSSGSTYSLYSSPFRARLPGEDGETSYRLLSTPLPPHKWISSIYMLPEGKTLLSTQPPRPGDPTGLYAYDLDTGEHTLAIPGASDLWRPGYYTLQPEVPIFGPDEQ